MMNKNVRIKTDMQETKKKVLEGNTSGNLLNYLVFFVSRAYRSRSNQTICLLLQLWSNMWSKKFRNFGWCGSGEKTLDFAPKMQKIKPKNDSFFGFIWSE